MNLPELIEWICRELQGMHKDDLTEFELALVEKLIKEDYLNWNEYGEVEET